MNGRVSVSTNLRLLCYRKQAMSRQSSQETSQEVPEHETARGSLKNSSQLRLSGGYKHAQQRPEWAQATHTHLADRTHAYTQRNWLSRGKRKVKPRQTWEWRQVWPLPKYPCPENGGLTSPNCLTTTPDQSLAEHYSMCLKIRTKQKCRELSVATYCGKDGFGRVSPVKLLNKQGSKTTSSFRDKILKESTLHQYIT